MSGNTDFDRARPFRNNFIESDFEQFVWSQRPQCQDDAVVEIVHSAVEKKKKIKNQIVWRKNEDF